MIKENRIEVLDSFRFIAILSVMLYHYYSRWTPPQSVVSLYPYGSKFDYFGNGWLGVEFFFIISGFVIAFTLTKSESLVEFLKRRLIRLFPAMLFCSVVSFTVFTIVDNDKLFPTSHSFKNLLYSIVFISPDFINKLFHNKITGTYLNGSYWSLWPEIQFYIVASVIYFASKKRFIDSIFVVNLLLVFVNYCILRIFANAHTTNRLHLNITNEFVLNYSFWTQTVFNYLFYSLYFLSGVLFYEIYSSKNRIKPLIYLCCIVFVQYYFYLRVEYNNTQISIILCMYIVFFLFLYANNWLKFLSIKPITSIGLASYSLYLIHENIGVLLINKYAYIFGKYNFIFPIFVIGLMITFSLYSFKYIEKPLSAFLKKKILN